jgi:hypothetical protein
MDKIVRPLETHAVEALGFERPGNGNADGQ